MAEDFRFGGNLPIKASPFGRGGTEGDGEGVEFRTDRRGAPLVARFVRFGLFGAPHPPLKRSPFPHWERQGVGLNRLCIHRYASNSGRLDASSCVRGGAEERGGGVVMRNLCNLFYLPILWYAPKNRRRKGAGGSRQKLNDSPLGTPLPTAF